VPEFEHAQSKAEKMSQLKDVLSRSRASQGPFGALEDGRLIDSLSFEDLKSSIAARGGNSNLQPWEMPTFRTIFLQNYKKSFGWPPAVLRFCFQVEKTKSFCDALLIEFLRPTFYNSILHFPNWLLMIFLLAPHRNICIG
jgi:hypothetical protein